MLSIKQLLETERQALVSSGIDSDSAKLEAELLLAKCLGKPRSYLYAFSEDEVSGEDVVLFKELIQKRQNGNPIAYLLGQQSFWSLSLDVAAGALVPRADTESLIEKILELPIAEEATIIDLGAGSGAIALALASEKKKWKVIAVEFYESAMKIASANNLKSRKESNDSGISLIQANWLSSIADNCMDLIVSNPPYIAEDDPHWTNGSLKEEPETALLSGSDGLDDIKKIVKQAPRCLKDGGYLILEHGYDQQEAVKSLLSNEGFVNVEGGNDLSGNPRFVLGVKQ